MIYSKPSPTKNMWDRAVTMCKSPTNAQEMREKPATFLSTLLPQRSAIVYHSFILRLIAAYMNTPGHYFDSLGMAGLVADRTADSAASPSLQTRHSDRMPSCLPCNFASD